jgi:hypothetical protein
MVEDSRVDVVCGVVLVEMDRIKWRVEDHSCVYPVRLSLIVSPSVKTCYVQEVKEERGCTQKE